MNRDGKDSARLCLGTAYRALTLKARDIARETLSVFNRGPAWVCPINKDCSLSLFSKQENKVHKFDQIWIFFCAKVPDRAQLQVE